MPSGRRPGSPSPHVGQSLQSRHSFPGILAILIGFGALLQALIYLPYILGLLAVALIGYLAYTRLR